MKLLILGGTIFVGRHLVECALENGHEVTLFNRGKHNPQLYPDVEKIHGDRDGGLSALKGRSWDAVIDTCGYTPRIVSQSAVMLADSAGHYTFISSISVYRETSKPDIDESGEVCRLEDPVVETVDGETYGGLKALCEEAAERVFPGRALNIRPGLIVGPHDPTDRFTYWPIRFVLGGDILTPQNHDVPVQIIDARDLAEWTLRMIEARVTGIFNAVGPDYFLTLGALLEACRFNSSPAANVVHVSEEFLQEKEVHAWSDIPVWIPDTPEMCGFARINCSKAILHGLTFRAVRTTAANTLAWAKSRPEGYQLLAGLKPDRERELLKQWVNR